MIRTRRSIACALVAVCTGLSPSINAQDERQTTVPLSDPSRTATLRVNVVRGAIAVRAADRKDVLVTVRNSDASGDAGRGKARAGRGAAQPDDPPPGLRRLTQPGGVSIAERENEISITAGMMRAADLTIEVPARTNLRLQGMGGAVAVEGVEGDLEISNVNGPVTLTNVAGSVVAQSMNGTVTVRLSRAGADKAMSFTSFNGHVDVTLPAAIRASFKLRSDRGDVYTDFDLDLRSPARGEPADGRDRRTGGRARIELNQAIHGAANGGGPEIELRTFNGNVYLRKGS